MKSRLRTSHNYLAYHIMSFYLQNRLGALFSGIKRPQGSLFNLITFSGNLAFTPNTVNNNLIIFNIARKLQAQNFNYDNWLTVLQNSRAMVFKKNQYKEAVMVFNLWCIDGDGMTFPEYKIKGQFDFQKNQPFSQRNFPEKASSLRGEHKGVIADMDPEMQGKSKYFSHQLIVADAVTIRFKPVSFTDTCPKVTVVTGSTSYRCNWYAIADTKDIHIFDAEKLRTDKVLYNLITEAIANPDKGLALKMSQFRYNHDTKNSGVSGFFQLYDKSKPGLFINGWRKIGPNQSSPGTVALKNVTYGSSDEKGILVDLSNAILDFPYNPSDQLHQQKNLTKQEFQQMKARVEYSEQKEKQSPEKNSKKQDDVRVSFNIPSKDGTAIHYPLKLTIKQEDKTIIEEQQFSVEEIEELFRSKGGVFLIRGKELTEGSISVSIAYDDKKTKTEWVQNPLVIEAVESFKKSELKSTLSQAQYSSELDFQLFCTKGGVPLNGSYPAELRTDAPDSIFVCFNQITPDQLVKLDNSEQQRKKVVKSITESNEQIKKNLVNLGQTDLCSQKAKYAWKVLSTKQTSQFFQLQFVNPITTKKSPDDFTTTETTLNFVDGKAIVKVRLSHDLTDDNNPRAPYMNSLCLNATITINEINKKGEKTKAGKVDISGIFFPSRTTPYEPVIDWINIVGPKLRTFAMVYPAMQKLANLYEFKLSMSSMKRAFDVQDEWHSRYMPSTRQMSPTEHRQIRKWLYFPHFDHKHCLDPNLDISLRRKKYLGTNPLTNRSWADQSREERKDHLIELLKRAWTVQLTTIPLYLGAMFSLKPHTPSWNHIHDVAIDEMKHLFIISNLLNAIGALPPFDDQKRIPQYPAALPNLYVTKQMDTRFDILPAVDEQLKKFMLIEYPTENRLLELSDRGIDSKQVKNKIYQLKDYLNKVNEIYQTEDKFVNIGQFYSSIIDKLWDFNDDHGKEGQNFLFSGDSRKQFTYFHLKDMSPIYDFRSALDQIRLIVQQGEGANVFDFEGQIKKKSHFFSFMEIFIGRHIKSIKSCRSPNQNEDQVCEYSKNKFVIQFENQMGNFNEASPQVVKGWTNERTQQVNQMIQAEYEANRVDSKATQFPNIFAPSTFTNSYAKIMQEFYFIFISEPKGEFDQFQSFRRRKMENAIAKMRQMAINSKRIIWPNDTMTQEKQKYNEGSKPNFNIGRLMKEFQQSLQQNKKSKDL